MLKKTKLVSLLTMLMLTFAALLVACGDSPTATPAPTTAAATTAPATTTAAATTVAATTAPATTAAATTTAAVTTKAATTAAAGSTSIPTFSGVNEISLPSSLSSEFLKAFPTLKDATFKVYGSADDAKTLSTSVDKTLTGAGYRAFFPGGFQSQGDSSVGLYVKTGSPDLLLVAGDITASSSPFSNVPGLSKTETEKLTAELSGKKSALIIISGTDLLTSLGQIGANSGTTTTAATTTTTRAATTAAVTTRAATTAAATTAATGSTTGTALTVPTITGATEVSIPAEAVTEFSKAVPQLKNPALKIYGSDDDVATLGANVDKALTGAGYKSFFPGGFQSQGGASVGFYTKTGAADILAVLSEASALNAGTGLPGVSGTSAQAFTSLLKGKKTALIVVGGTDLLTTMMQAGGSTGTGSTGGTTGTGSTGGTTGTGSSSGSVEKVSGKLGETLSKNGYKITVANLERTDAPSRFTTPKAGNTFIVVEITIESSQDKGVSVNPLYATVKDAAGKDYDVSFGGKDPMLKSKNDLPNGEKMTGFLSFEVPTDAKGLSLVYEPILGDVTFTFTLN